MLSLVFLAVLACPFATFDNKSDDPFNARDYNAFKTSKNHCRVYYPKSPCLIKLIKKTKTDYNAICGAKR